MFSPSKALRVNRVDDLRVDDASVTSHRTSGGFLEPFQQFTGLPGKITSRRLLDEFFEGVRLERICLESLRVVPGDGRQLARYRIVERARLKTALQGLRDG